MKGLLDIAIGLLMLVTVLSAIVLYIQMIMRHPRLNYGEGDWIFKILRITIPAIIVLIIITYII